MTHSHTLALCAALLTLTPAVGWGDVLHRSGPPEDRLDLVILADGYPSAEKGDFEREARRVLDALRSTEPFRTYLGLMNVTTGFRPSPTSGASERNAYGSHFVGGFLSTRMRAERMPLLLGDAVRAAGDADAVLVIVKGTRRGGTAHGNVCFVTAGAGPRTALHELGHAIGRLGDEYSGMSGTPTLSREAISERYPNLTTKKRRDELPWKDWVASETRVPGNFFTQGVSAFEGGGAYSTGLYRPKRACRMRTDGPGFCEVCRQHLVLAFHQASRPLRFLASGSGSARSVRLASALPTGSWATRWSGVNASGLEAAVPAGLSASVLAEDRTPWVRGEHRLGLRYRFDAHTGEGARLGPGNGLSGEVANVTSRLRVRDRPSASGGVLGHVLPGEELQIVGPYADGFYPIAFSGGVGYVSYQYVRPNRERGGILQALGAPQ